MLPNVNIRTDINDSMIRQSIENLDSGLESELESMLTERRSRDVIDRERDLNMYRSGSAPPTVEGSLNAVGSLFRNPNIVQIDDISHANGVLTEEEIRSHPAYLSYYYSPDNINPRLPPPLLSKEDWRIAQRFQSGGTTYGGIGDWRNKNLVDDGGGSSLFSMQPGLSVQKAEDELMELRMAATRNISRNSSSERIDRGAGSSIGVPRAGMGLRRKSFADILQEGLEQGNSLSGRLSRPASHNAFGDLVDTTGGANSHSVELCNGTNSTVAMHNGSNGLGPSRVQNIGSAVPHSFASAVGSSLSRSRTPEPHLIGRSPSPGLPPVGSRISPVEKKSIASSNSFNGLSSNMNEFSDVAASLSGLSLSKNRVYSEDNLLQSGLQMGFDKQANHLYDMSNGHRQSLQQQFLNKSRPESLAVTTNYIDLLKENRSVGDLNISKLGLDGQVNFPRRTSSSANLQSRENSSGFGTFEALNSTGNGLSLRSSNQAVSDLHSPVMYPRYIEDLQSPSHYSTHSRGRNYSDFSPGHGDVQSLQRAYLESLLAQQKQQYELPFRGKSGSLNHQYGLGMPYQGNSMANLVLPSVGPGSPGFQNEQIPHFTSMLRSSMGGSTDSWYPEAGMKGNFASSSLLEEIKNNKTRSFELSDIVDHVVQFSTDQYGSRFIQQKLETATVEEKTKIFSEIIPIARSLMTDVFGNYVIQKFFEHGTENQRKELASQVIGHVLPLSLQMYGCRVIQKALEVVDVIQQTQMVAELDGSIMKCVRDQNGNHVIQKCIECVPQDRIQFIISPFLGQVVALSTHPYGCRVIQRVLEHCDEPTTQQFIMDEIMKSVCTLAQDQYGNYVIQHVLQHGKPHERSVIIGKLAGQIVKMSQQKFASNVVEKCLTFGGPEERQILVNEMLGYTDENEPLQAMMKDPFGNYVVQKVLETCDDKSRELIISRIKVHLNALKRYTYGKHIVSRVEKLITTGERQMALSSLSS